MTRQGELEIESYRLAQYSVQVGCYICGGPNTFDAELCRSCQAPMSLAHQAETKKVSPHMVATIGSAAAGKTVYLGMLIDVLSRQCADLQLLARGAFSVTLQQGAMEALTNCRFPEKTPNEPDRWNWVHCQVKAARRKHPIELIMPDLAGEALLQELEHPHTYPVIRSFLSKCSAALLLVDAERLEEGELDQDYVMMKIITYLCELKNDPKTGWSNRACAIVFTKSDRNEICFVDPRGFAEKYTPGLWKHSQEQLSKHAFFATGVAGACAFRQELGGKRQIPLRVEPRGIIEPFAWIVGQLPK